MVTYYNQLDSANAGAHKSQVNLFEIRKAIRPNQNIKFW